MTLSELFMLPVKGYSYFKLSNIYKNNTFYVVAYETGHGDFELVSKTFTTIESAQNFIKVEEGFQNNYPNDYDKLSMHIIPIKLRILTIKDIEEMIFNMDKQEEGG